MIDECTPKAATPDSRNPKPADAALVNRLFKTRAALCSSVAAKALRIREMTEAIDPFIQIHTSAICPQCRNVCCVNKHGRYDYDDIIYLYGLGFIPQDHPSDIRDGDPCRFLTPSGCSIERPLRPFRCNWHFCPDLIAAIEQGPAKPYRSFVLQFQEIQRLRAEMIEDFERVRLLDSRHEPG